MKFYACPQAFESVCSDASVLALWQSMSPEKRFSLLMRITDQMDHCNSEIRTTASRALLYIAQVGVVIVGWRLVGVGPLRPE